MMARTVSKLDLAKLAATKVRYDRESGKFFWLFQADGTFAAASWNSRLAGKEAGKVVDTGHRRIGVSVDGRRQVIFAHRLAWFMVNGELPKGMLDHINQNPDDNRVENLRDVGYLENARNRRMHSRNASGFNGVCLHKKTGRWQAGTKRDGKSVYLGLFDTPEAAAQAVRDFQTANGYTEHHGKPTHG